MHERAVIHQVPVPRRRPKAGIGAEDRNEARVEAKGVPEVAVDVAGELLGVDAAVAVDVSVLELELEARAVDLDG